jgi:hypothetical protein
VASEFGGIYVNLETHEIVDLLADREAENVKRWLISNPVNHCIFPKPVALSKCEAIFRI